mmetsp:Transcript_4895/g.18374  ORF Transcript_4895/g.18374 Transcript_4895/m.18374 type:complete len:547 (+) Transcript_4895:165-1805(+)
MNPPNAKKRKLEQSDDSMHDEAAAVHQAPTNDTFDYDEIDQDDIMIGEFDFTGSAEKKAKQHKLRQLSKKVAVIGSKKNDENGEMMMGDSDDDEDDVKRQQANIKPFLPQTQSTTQNKQQDEYRVEDLDFSNSAYKCLHRFTAPWPIPSCSFIYSDYDSTEFPFKLLLVSGNQIADENGNMPLVKGTRTKQKNQIHLWTLFNLYSTEHDSDDDEMNPMPLREKEIPPAFEIEEIVVQGPNNQPLGDQNRVRVMPYGTDAHAAHGKPVIAALYCDRGHVSIVDISKGVKHVTNKAFIPKKGEKAMSVLYTSPNVSEGWGLDWSTVKVGRLASGGQDKTIRVYDFDPSTGKTEEVCSLVGHTGSVEDLQWSPSEPHVLASCGCDGTIRIWDVRTGKQQLMWKVSDTDVNVISWNPIDQTQIASGDDSGVLRVWNLEEIYKTAMRQGTPSLDNAKPSEHFDFHKHAITSLEWHPTDPSMIVATSEDDTCTIWDFGLEAEEEQEDVPPQLLFVHMGLQFVKEAHWHKKIENSLVVVGENSLHMFKPSNLE